METNTYNGWTNYATWRVNHDFFHYSTDARQWTPVEAREFVKEFIVGTTNECLGRSYAEAFLAEVDWKQIASLHSEETAYKVGQTV